MWKSSLRSVTPFVRKSYCACLKSTVASPGIIDDHSYKPWSEMPGPKGRYAIPMLGPLFYMKPFGDYTPVEFNKVLDDLHDKHGRTFRFELVGKCVITAHPESIAVMFRNEGRQPFRWPVSLLDHYANKNKVQRSLGTINGEEWQKTRLATQKYMLKVNSASIYVGAQIDVTNDLITRMSTLKYTPEEFRDELFKFATESIGVVCFNKRLGFMDANGKELNKDQQIYLDSIKQFFELLFKDVGIPLYKIYPTKLYRDFEKVANAAYGYGLKQVREVIEKAQRQMKEGTFNPQEPNLILQLQSDSRSTPESVNSTLLDLLTGGTDSTAKNLEILLLVLALNPDKQQKLYEEIVNVVGPKGSEVEADDMAKMPYFRACMKESLRLHFPVAFGTLRILPNDVVIDGYLVPKGTNILANSRRVCKNSEYFPSPDKYIPERWLRDEHSNKREQDIPAFSLLPFGFGSRNCLGRRFAEQEMWLGVTKIIQNFHVKVSENDGNPEMIYTTFGQVKDPVTFTFTPR